MAVERVTVDHRVMGGVPCVRGTRIPVATIVGLIAEGATPDEILADHSQLALDDVRVCLRYAAKAVDERELPVRDRTERGAVPPFLQAAGRSSGHPRGEPS